MSKKKLKGTIVSDATQKTVVVLINRFIKHPKYGKYIRKSKKYKAHNGKGQYKTGDKVVIQECRPISKDKKFEVLSKI